MKLDELEVEIRNYKDDSEVAVQQIAVRSALAAVPYAGSALVELWSGLAQRRSQERLNSVFDQMKNRLNRLGEEKIDREFFRPEEFQSLLFLLLERLHTTHDSDRLRMFGNALANSSSLDFKADDKELYIRRLRELSLRDLNILNHEYMKNWTPHTRAIEYRPEVMVSLFRLLGMGLVLETLKAKEVPVGRTGSDRLDAQNAISELLTQPPRRIFHISEFGAKFLDFISVEANSNKP